MTSFQFLSLDFAYFGAALASRLHRHEVRELAVRYLRDEPFKEIANRLLLSLADRDILYFLFRLHPDPRSLQDIIISGTLAVLSLSFSISLFVVESIGVF
jgi:hypothetical protein